MCSSLLTQEERRGGRGKGTAMGKRGWEEEEEEEEAAESIMPRGFFSFRPGVIEYSNCK